MMKRTEKKHRPKRCKSKFKRRNTKTSIIDTNLGQQYNSVKT